jgi:hypothetical protein
MQTGLEISTDFVDEIVLPLLRREVPRDMDKIAVAVVGTGSDVLGLDDSISRDHHWGPRANVMYCGRDDVGLPQRIDVALLKCPREYREFGVEINNATMTGLCSSEVESYLSASLGGRKIPPQKDTEWLDLCEVDLFQATSGTVVHDGPGELTRLRQEIQYYPDTIWRKKIADWCMYLSGRDSPYNFHRVSKRGDELTGRIYLAMYTKRVMEFCFAINKQYAPYTKWLNVLMRRLPKYVAPVAPMLDELTELTDARAKVMKQVEINFYFALVLAELGLTSKPVKREFDESLTDLTLYYSAAEIYRTLPVEYLDFSFNQIENWEPVARKAILDPNDFVQKADEDPS